MLTSTQIAHISRNVKQRLMKPKVAIIGGYHGGNLGDMALGLSISKILDERGVSNGLQTIYNLEKWPKVSYAIVGGGAIGYVESLRELARRYNGNLKNVSLLGVDFNESSYPQDCIALIESAAYVSGRSEAQAANLKQITGREDIHFHPDIAFSLYKTFCKYHWFKKDLKKHKKLLVNVISLYGKLVNGKVVPSESFRDERPELYETHGKMFSAYSTLVRQIVQDAIKDGFEVETIPFTNEDEAFGEIILKGLPVKLNRYHDDPYKMIKYMATATRIFATRYHTTIFSIKLGIPVYAVAYAYKNELLFDDLGVKRPYFISSTDLLTDDNPVLKPLMVDRKIIEDFELRSTLAIEASYEALNENI